MLLFTLFVASCYGEQEMAVGFGQETERIECWFGKCEYIDNPDSGHTHSGGGSFGGQTITVGECLLLECMEYFGKQANRGSCEDSDGWGCVPFTLDAPRCEWNSDCEKNADKWVGDGHCDFKACGNCYGFYKNDVFDGGDCTKSQMTAAGAPEAKVVGYQEIKAGAICAGSFYLKGIASSSKDGCEQQCDSRSGCDTFCWSNKSPMWDCLMYTGCSRFDSRFGDGSTSRDYNCYKKPGAEATEMLSNVVEAETVGTFVLDFFALVGIFFVVLVLYRLVTMPKTAEMLPIPTESSPFQTTTQ